MPIDPARLARIRNRLLAAAAVTTVGCAGASTEQINPAPDRTFNQPARAETPPPGAEETRLQVAAPEGGAQNEVAGGAPDSPSPQPDGPHINTPAPDKAEPTAAPGRHINTPAPDKAGPPSQPDLVNTPPPSRDPKPTLGGHVNTPPPGAR